MTYDVNPMYLLGLEGLYSMLLQVIILTSLQFIKCTETLTLCINGKVEDTMFAFRQIGDNPYILLVLCLYLITSSGFRISGLYLIKIASASNRITIDISRTVLIWAFFLCYPETDEHLNENFDYVQLIGFVIQSFGTLLFNEIVVLPFLGFNKNLNKNQIKSQGKTEENRPLLATSDISATHQT